MTCLEHIAFPILPLAAGHGLLVLGGLMPLHLGSVAILGLYLLLGSKLLLSWMLPRLAQARADHVMYYRINV